MNATKETVASQAKESARSVDKEQEEIKLENKQTEVPEVSELPETVKPTETIDAPELPETTEQPVKTVYESPQTARIETMERRIAELEAFAVVAKRKMHFADQEVIMPTKRNYNPDYLPHTTEGVVSYHDKPKNE